MLEDIAPQGDEIVLPKTSSSSSTPPSSTICSRNIGIEDVFVVGFLTDQCIDHAVKDGADRGYLHDLRARCLHCRNGGSARGGAQCFKGYCRMLTTDEVLGSRAKLNRLRRSGRKAPAARAQRHGPSSERLWRR